MQPFYHKLLGTGADTIGMIMKENYLNDLLAAGYSLVDNAHNEFLQILVTHGVLGLVCYLGFFATGIIYPVFKDKGTYSLNKAFALAALCYLAQSVVNIYQPITTPLAFVFVAAAMSGNMTVSE